MAGLRGPLKSSANAGQFSEDLYGKVGLKPYYSAAKIMRGLEPIPQAGFANLPGSVDIGEVLSPICTMGVLKVSSVLSYTLVFTEGKAEIWRSDRVKVATLTIAAITLAMIPELKFYGEANTFGIFHVDLNDGIVLRIFRNASDDSLWTIDSWPFEFLPEVDLGGTYSVTEDRWDIFIRWADGTAQIILSCTLEGVAAASVALGAPPDTASNLDWSHFAEDIQAALNALPGFATGIAVNATGAADHYRQLTVRFTEGLAGSEYEFDAQIVNTSDASALVNHAVVGSTAGEALVSASKGGFSGMDIYQDRAVYYGPKARRAAIAMSRIGEYFDLNIKSTSDAGARLEALRTSTAETIRHIMDNTFLLVFTDQAEWFASNRTVSRNEPLNWVRASEVGSKANCNPVSIDGLVFFVSPDGGILYSISYDAVSTTYIPTAENDLCKDLLSSIANQVVQRKIGSSTSSRNWIRREDGKLICLIVNKAREQNIVAPAEWGVHAGGLVRSHCKDISEQIWLVVERDGIGRLEILEEASVNLLQAAIYCNIDSDGVASGLDLHEGRTVWAEIAGDFHGPFTVVDGAIVTEVTSVAALVGLWEPPVYESMPYVQVLQDDTIIRRPGQVKAALLYVIDTDSIAIGANGRPPKDIPLNRMTDDLTAAKKGYTGDIKVAGLNGISMAPTITITQVKPGRLRLRDYIPGVKL